MNCRASLANVSRLRIQSWIYSLGGWRFERGKEHVPWIHFRIACKVQRRLSLFWNRIDHHLLRANVSHGIRRREILWIFQQTFTRNWISQNRKERNSQKISSARSCLLLFFVLDTSARWVNVFRYINEQVETWRKAKMLTKTERYR